MMLAQTSVQTSDGAYTDAFLDPLITVFNTVKESLFNTQGAALFAILSLLILMNIFQGKRHHLTSAEWAKTGDKLKAIAAAQKALRKKTTQNVCLWCGSIAKWQTLPGVSEVLTFVTKRTSSVLVPSANRSIIVVGKAGSGKTFSAIDPMLCSAIEQGHPILLYDYKADENGDGGQISYIATLAARYGYRVRIFAPGRAYTCAINPLDFLADKDDATTAKVLAEVFHKNLKTGGGKTDAFFGPAGQRLIQALLQFAKGTKYPDLAMAFSVAQLPNLVERLAYAAEQNRLSYFVQVNFSQFIQSGASEKTSSGIIATASDVLTRFIDPRLLTSLLGDTNVSPMIGEKEILVFQSDIFRQDVINPLLAAIINVVINKNFAVSRKVPLIFGADEFPTIFMPSSPRWPNEHRSKGFVGIFGYQSFPQLVEGYGEQNAKILAAACSTRFLFNPGDIQTAEGYSKEIGEKEVTYRTKSWSRTRGDDRGRNRSISEQVRTRPLILADEVMRFGVGECIFINPDYNQKPIHFKKRLQIPTKDIERRKTCEKLWPMVRKKLIRAESRRRHNLDLEKQIEIRFREAERLLPMPPSQGNNKGVSAFDTPQW